MKESFCEILLDYLPSDSELEDFYLTTITNCVLNSLLSYIAIMLNMATIHAVRKTSSLPKTLKPLLLSLAVSDVGVGLFVQTFYTLFLILWLQQKNLDCTKYMALNIISHIFSSASFLGVVAVSVDRFLAIHLHLRYQELVTHKVVVAVVISIWVLSIIGPFSIFFVPLDIYSRIMVILGISGVILTTMVYVRIYLAVRRHKNQIQVLQVRQVAQTDQVANISSLIKSAVGIFYVYFVFLVCYLPYLIILVAIKINGPSIFLKRCYIFSLTLVFVNSSLNPVIYCWKMRNIRNAVINILRNVFRQRSRTSHQTFELTGHAMP